MNKHDLAPALQIRNLSVNYELSPVLSNISVTIPTGKLVGIVGPNGAGKSTLLKTSLGLLTPNAGKVEFFGKSLSEVRLQVAYVPQRESVDWDFPITVRELVLMGRYGRLGLFRRPKKEDLLAVDHYLEKLEMLPYANRQINDLSGGQQQRAFLARALIQEADIYFMDEPFAAIDIATEAAIINILKGLRDQGKTIFVVNHNLNSVERYFDWIILLNVKLIACGEVSKVFTLNAIMEAYGKDHFFFNDAIRLPKERSGPL